LFNIALIGSLDSSPLELPPELAFPLELGGFAFPPKKFAALNENLLNRLTNSLDQDYSPSFVMPCS
jgi:hypothetical protein